MLIKASIMGRKQSYDFCIFTVAFILILAPAGALTMQGQFPNPAGHSLTRALPNINNPSSVYVKIRRNQQLRILPLTRKYLMLLQYIRYQKSGGYPVSGQICIKSLFRISVTGTSSPRNGHSQRTPRYVIWPALQFNKA